MRVPFILFAGILLLMACGGRDRVPADILPPARMQQVMWDMISAGEFLNGYVLNKDSADKLSESAKLYGQVLQFHHVTQEEFDKSYRYYRQHPQLMKEILDTLSKRQIVPEKIGEKKDSIAGNAEAMAPRRDTLRYSDAVLRRRDSLRDRLFRKKISP